MNGPDGYGEVLLAKGVALLVILAVAGLLWLAGYAWEWLAMWLT